MVKNPSAIAGVVRDAGSILGSGRSPGGGHGNPLQHSLGQRSLAGYILQGQKSQTRLKRLNTHFNLTFNIDLALLSTVFTSFSGIIN